MHFKQNHLNVPRSQTAVQQ